MKRRDKQKLRDFIDRVKAIKWPKIKAANKSEQRFIATVLDAVNILELEIICGNVLPELPEDSATYLPTAPDVELNLQIIKKNLYPLVEILRDLEPKKHKAALKHMRNLLDAVGYSWRIVPRDDAAKERDESWQRRRSAKELEARGALVAIVSNLAGNRRPVHPYEWIEQKLKTINKKLTGMGHTPLITNFADAEGVRNASDVVHRILTDLPENSSRS
ncbi:MAG: hypothetical protein WDN02_07390 [Methylovirgula sp.]|uniref:hypothetical protein n=1 Tax=Methylovirgula sp. TaxID=1978224 RepID=UPI0030765479